MEQERQATQEHHATDGHQAAQEHHDERKRPEAEKNWIVIVYPVIVFVLIITIMLKTVVVPNQQYKKALKKYGSSIKAASVGDTIKFGYFEQDNNTSNGKEAIEWLVLIDEGNRLGLISKYALDCQPYNGSRSKVTWETCYVRKWLNGFFLNEAFDVGEQKLIQRSTVTADNVFLLSLEEAVEFFGSDRARQCRGTAYCYAHAVPNDSNGNCWWWLRSSGIDLDCADMVIGDGAISNNILVDSKGAVRPALWINLGS